MIPAMTSEKVHKYLYELGKSWELGTAMELGCWLGASSVPLLKGLLEAGYNKTFWAFDRWNANAEQVQKAKNQGVNLYAGQNTEFIYQSNVMSLYNQVRTVRGNLPDTLDNYTLHGAHTNNMISICIFDAPKQEPIFSGCMEKLLPYFIPGRTVLGLLDYRFHERHVGIKKKRFAAPVNYMGKHKQNWKLIKMWDDECPVFFKYVKPY